MEIPFLMGLGIEICQSTQLTQKHVPGFPAVVLNTIMYNNKSNWRPLCSEMVGSLLVKYAGNLYNKVIECLNEQEVFFFSYYFSKRWLFSISDTRREGYPTLLKTLTKLEVHKFDADKYEYCFWIKELGKKLLKRISSLIDEKNYEELKLKMDKDYHLK